MTKKKKQDLISKANMMAGTLPFKDEDCQRFVPIILSTLVFGYYLGAGHGGKTASNKAQKFMNDVEMDV